MQDRIEQIEQALLNQDVDALHRLKDSCTDEAEHDTIVAIINNLDNTDWSYDRARDNA